MKKTVMIACLCFCGQLMFAQKESPKTTKSAHQTDLEAKVKSISAMLADLQSHLYDTTKTDERFTPAFVDSIYAMQRTLEDISYQAYEKTDYPVEVVDTSLTVEGKVLDDTDDPFSTDADSLEPKPKPEGPSQGGSNPFGFLQKRKSPRTILRLAYNFGFTDLAEFGDRTQGLVYPTFDLPKSHNNSWQLMLESRLGKRDTTGFFIGGFNPKKPWKHDDQFKNNRISLRYGLTFDQYFIREVNNAVLSLENNRSTFTSLGTNAKENILNVRYLSIPVVLQVKFGKNLQVQGGVFGGALTVTEQRIKYNENNFEYERRRRDNYGLTKFNYGFALGLGFDSVFLTARLSMSPFFRDNDNYNYRLLSYGLTISL